MTAVLDTEVLTPRLSRAHLDALAAAEAASMRGVVVGGAGARKSVVLDRLRRAWADRGFRVVDWHAGIGAVAPTDVVLVDDAHRLDEADLRRLLDRADDPSAPMVIATRPWPQSDALRALAHRLEASRPPIVLGHVGAADIAATGVADDCAADLADRCGRIAWLVTDALSVHVDDDCDPAHDHPALDDALQELIAHRVAGLPDELRAAIEAMCLDAEIGSVGAEHDELVAAGHAEGLLERNGRPAPVVVAAVHATVSAARARELTDRAATSGPDAAAAQLMRAEAAWSAGRVDDAAAMVDTIASDDPAVQHRATALSAAIWAARGLTVHSHRAFAACPPARSTPRAQALVASLAIGDADAAAVWRPHDGMAAPSTASVASDLLARGLTASLATGSTADGGSRAALRDLVRAAEMYSATGSDEPLVAPPAVIAALAAMHDGDLGVAAGVLDDAIRAGHGGVRSAPSLRLWRAWVDLQLQRPHDVEAVLSSLEAGGLTPRDRLLADALRVGLARRYADAAGLAVAWRAVRDRVFRAQFDLFSVLPLGEFAVTAGRFGDSDLVADPMRRVLADLDRLGSPALWSPHVHWTGVQQGILADSPEALRPHARALVQAAPGSRVAAAMATAGRVWTEVLGAHVDADAVEASALALAEIGLAWDGARLAGHGAARTDDRRAISRLLATARQLHPTDDHGPAQTAADDGGPAAAAGPGGALTGREREVAVLVVQGLTYAEIGETIYISPRTAEHHIARIRRRLGATSRSDLIAKLRAALDGVGDLAAPRMAAGT